ncbi:MAG: chemotaxis protein CheW [Pseudomonadota bacterium]
MDIIEAPRATVTALPPAATSELFGSFLLGADEFALPAQCIREVVNMPDKLSVLPLCPAYLAGMFTLRGCVIPVVNLARLFDPSAGPATPAHKIAIVDHQQVQVGILFDATGEILRVRPEQRSRLAYGQGDAQGVIAGTILLDDGARLLQILEPGSLISVENVPHVMALRIAAQAQHGQRAAQAKRRKCVSFHAAGASFALDMAAIQEIIRVPELQASVLNSKLCLGRINFRGSQVAVVDFAVLLDTAAPPAARDGEQRIVIARLGDASVGFLVDSVDSIVHFSDEEVLPIPLLGKARTGMFVGCIAQAGLSNVILLDHQQVLSSTELVELRAGHARLFPGQDQAAGHAQRKAQRQVYLTFRVQETYALEIRRVREIIDYSGAVTRPPGLPSFLCGVLNLRQQMISIIDLRQLYGMAQAPQPDQRKVLVIEHGEERYGLLVDAMEDIVTVDDRQRYATPKLMRNSQCEAQLQGEMSEVIDVPHKDGASHTLCIFDAEHLLRRLAQTTQQAL